MSASHEFRRIIRRLAAAALLPALSACATLQSPGGNITYVAMPLLGQAYERDIYNREGTSFYNPRWAFDPDSHPAVRPATAREGAQLSPYPPVSTRSSAEIRADGQLAGGAIGALVGALVGAQAGSRTAGIAVGSAVGALAGGRAADPCQPASNLGSVWGTLAGGWFGSLFGGGRGRDFWMALGAAGGATRGTEMGAEGRRCR